MVVFPAVERKEGVEAVPGVPWCAGVDRGCRFQEGPPPQAHQQTLDPQEPDHPMQPHPVSPAATADQSADQQQKESDRTATRPRLLPPKDIYATLASTLAHPMDAEQYYQRVLQELPANRAALQGWRQTKGGDNEWGPEDNLLREDTWYGTMEAVAASRCWMARRT